ncbi:MAG: cytochrome c [bacterium]|nr:cytochrome c [bacterium]MCP4965125.1 cytochrome c [bacterium]
MRVWLVGLALLLVLGSCSLKEEYVVGGELYDRSCAACHGTDGGGAIADAIGAGSNTHLNLSDEQIAGVIVVGPGNMPGFSRFTTEQVDSLVDYVRAFAE